MDTIKVPCTTHGCDGEVYAARELNEEGTVWQIVWFEDVPVVLCSRGCRAPEELVGLIEPDIRAA
ncbi:hypothetical protein [Terrabacter sp. Soil811]|uniref:hypothetical protein n=1 Tax=Terrabacter sp. Soil811 TaxID=1736419 RepID=UPI000A8C4BAA|nr:hypothetical protein [Terrabacter sp. Soil811]